VPGCTVAHDHKTPSNPAGRNVRTNDFFTLSLDELIEHHATYLKHLKHVRDKGGMLLSETGDPLAFWVATQPCKLAHFATWPMRLVKPMIKASTSEKGCCPACGAPWVRVFEPCTVLDNFNGAGTTGVVATSLGRRYIGVDLNPEYLAMARQRLDRPNAPIAKRPVGDVAAADDSFSLAS
jgi:hypothetical protein